MRVLVTGHQGYLGAVLVPMLLEAGHEVTGLDTGWFASCWLGPRMDFGIPELDADLRDLPPGALDGFEAVIHLAALSNDPLGNLDPELTRSINYRASLALAERAREAGVRRFLFSSSCSTYGAAGDDFLDEDAAFNPVTPYGVSKVELERGLSALADDDFSPVYLRNATAHGLSPLLRLDLVLNNLVAWAHTTGKVLLLSDGTPWRPIVHAEDIGRAFLAALAAPEDRIHDRAFNVGRTDENFRILELAEIVAEVVPGSRIEIAEGAGPDKRCYRVNCDRIVEELPFRPKRTARDSARELYEAYKAVGLTHEQLEGSRYFRLRTLKEHLERGRLDDQLRWTEAGAESAAS